MDVREEENGEGPHFVDIFKYKALIVLFTERQRKYYFPISVTKRSLNIVYNDLVA